MAKTKKSGNSETDYNKGGFKLPGRPRTPGGEEAPQHHQHYNGREIPPTKDQIEAHDSAMAAYQANLQVDNDVFQGPRIKVRGRRHNRGRSASSFSFQRQNNAQNPGNTSGLNSNPNSNEMQARDKVSLQNYKITKINSNQAGDANRGANANPNLNPNIRFKF